MMIQDVPLSRKRRFALAEVCICDDRDLIPVSGGSIVRRQSFFHIDTGAFEEKLVLCWTQGTSEYLALVFNSAGSQKLLENLCPYHLVAWIEVPVSTTRSFVYTIVHIVQLKHFGSLELH